jgi:hypothetical protein
MIRRRWAAALALAGLGLFSGCTSCNNGCGGLGIGNGQLLDRLRHSNNGCPCPCPCEMTSMSGPSPLCCEGGPGHDFPGGLAGPGPIMTGPSGGMPMIPPAMTGPPPLPAPSPLPEGGLAQPEAAGPTSRIKRAN